jgi:hypothetical protein
MAIVLKKSTTRSDKGQRSLTVQDTTTEKEARTAQNTAARQDTQTAKAPITLQIAFKIRFRHTTPVLPDGEVEPTTTCS